MSNKPPALDLTALADLPEELLKSMEDGELSRLPPRAISALARAKKPGFLVVPRLGRRATRRLLYSLWERDRGAALAPVLTVEVRRGGLVEVRLEVHPARRRLTPEGVRIARTILDVTVGDHSGAHPSEVWGVVLPRDLDYACRQLLDLVEDHSTPWGPVYRRPDAPPAQEHLVAEGGPADGE
jgi:hypothetical protein